MLILDRREKPRPNQSSNRDIIEQVAKYRDVEYCIMELNSADCRFEGYGEKGDCIVGCERKRLSDLINSMKDRRLAGRQIREMHNEHDYIFLFIEGMWRPGKDGEIEEYTTRRGGKMGWYPVYGRQDKFAVSYRQLIAFLTTLELKAGVVVRRTASAWETAAQYVALYHWFTEKTWDKHRSHDQIYTNQVIVGGHRARMAGISNRTEPSWLWKALAQADGLDEKARAAADYFGSIRAMALGTVADWQAVPGIGKVLAERYVKGVKEKTGSGTN